MQNKRKKATQLLSYGSDVNSVSHFTGLGLRVTRVLLKQLKSGTLLPYSDFRGRIYRGYINDNR